MFGIKKQKSMSVEQITNIKIRNDPVIRQAINCGTDLVLVSSHNTVCETCQKFEGKIFSITGMDSRFPLLADVPPFCENCRHTIYPTFESALKIEHSLQKYIDFSNGKTDHHPFNKGFIPISKRPKIDLDKELKMRKEVVAIKKKISTRQKNLLDTKEGTSNKIRLEQEIAELNISIDQIKRDIDNLGGWSKFIPKIAKDYPELFNIK